jgi:hypothetical protein
MSPGFAYPDYQSGDRAELVGRFPDFATMIERLTPDE